MMKDSASAKTVPGKIPHHELARDLDTAARFPTLCGGIPAD
jgi:hypothetical protein